MVKTKSFLPKYDEEFAVRLGKRAAGFRTMFQALEALDKGFYRIIETGTVRVSGNWEGDGQSTVLFDEFVNFHDGAVFSVDLNPAAVATARSLTSSKTHCICSDSVRFLRDLAQLTDPATRPDLIYLDSYDLDAADPLPSMFHHIKELLAVGSLAPGCIIATDDNLVHEGVFVGKGKLVEEYFNNVGVEQIYREYQMVWRVT